MCVIILIIITLAAMDNKIKLFLDFDETITKSSKQFVKIANNKFGIDKDYREYKTWNFVNLYPEITLEEVNDIFCCKDFFVDLEVYEGVVESLRKLKDKVEIHIATIGIKENLQNKIEWLDKTLIDVNYIFDGIEEDGSSITYDKSCIDMKNSIFVDDRMDNLRSTNADIKILFKDYCNHYWQRYEPNESVYITNTWEEIYKIIDFFVKNPELIKGANDCV